MKKALLSLKNKAIPAKQLQDDLFTLDSSLDELISMMEVAKNDPKVSFVVPQGFCQLKEAVTLKLADVKAFYSLFAGLKVGANLLHAYTIGLDPAQLITVSDNGQFVTINQTGFVNDANGGTDGKLFAELSASPDVMKSFTPLIMSGLTSFIDVMDAVKIDDQYSDLKSNTLIFYKILGAHKHLFRTINEGAKDVKASLVSGTMTPLTNLKHDKIQIDVTKALSKLPNPKTVTGFDPFVIDPKTKKATSVPEYFKALFNGIATFEIKKVEVPAILVDLAPFGCIPKCDGKQCGNNGCGGSCGTCGDGQSCSINSLCVNKGPAPTISGVPTFPILTVPIGQTKTVETKTIIASVVGLATVSLQCGGDVMIVATPAYDPAVAKNKYAFNLQIGNVALSTICQIKATDTLGQESSATFQVMQAQ